ncbi:MAG TPA: hypothetical protein VMA96_03240 [Solirubrobacteraceae bacterium]|nr:hypothetical protein [Solirubrobacteraceae bacterium]
MRPEQSPEEHEARAITRLVDAAPAERGTERDKDWAAQPDVRRQVESQRRVSHELRSGGPPVPDRLVRSVEDKVRERYGDADRARSRRLTSGPSWRPAVAVAGLAAICAAVVIGVVGLGGGSSGPTIPAAAGLAFAPSTGPAPATRTATLLGVSYGGVTYPNYAKFSVPATGTRTDRIGGRPALTVFYRLPNGKRLSYTVFSGTAIPLPHDARTVTYEGVPLKEFSTSSGLSVVTLVRFGRTCVLAAPVKPNVVLGLAAAPVLEQAHA